MGAISSSKRYYWFGLSPGTAALHYSCEYQAATPSEADHPGFLALFAFPNPLSTRFQGSFFEPRKPDSRGIPRLLVGDFRMDSHRAKTSWLKADPYHVTFRLELPLWVPWLVFIGLSFVVCRFMEKRTTVELKKALARGNLSASLPDEPA